MSLGRVKPILEELRALGVEYRFASGGLAPGTVRLTNFPQLPPEVRQKVAETLKRYGYSETREGLWGGASTTEEQLQQWETEQRELREARARLRDEMADCLDCQELLTRGERHEIVLEAHEHHHAGPWSNG
jgi:hypothetical protein